MTVSDLIQQAETLTAIERWSEAEGVLARALAMEPQNAEVLGRLALVNLKTGRWAAARRLAEQTVAAEPEGDEGHRILSLVFREGAFKAEAVEAAHRAVECDAAHAGNWHALTLAYLKAGALGDAEAAAESLRRLAPEWYLTYQCLALIAIQRREFAKAEEFCREELRLNPSSYHGMNNLGVALLGRRKRRPAVETFHQAAKLNPREPVAQKNLLASASGVLPRVGLGGVAIWLLLKFLYLVFVTLSLTKGLLLAGAGLVGIAGAVYLWYGARDRRYSPEVRNFLLSSEPRAGRDSHRDLLMGIWGGSLLLSGLWLAYRYAFRNVTEPLPGRIEIWAVPLVLLTIGTFAARTHWRLKRKY